MENRETQTFNLEAWKYDYSYNIIQANTELKPAEKQLLTKIINLSKENGYCYATYETLSKLIGTKKSYIKDLVNDLVEKWYITKQLYMEKFKRNNHLTPIREKILDTKNYNSDIKLIGTPNKADFIPKRKRELIDPDKEVYIYNTGNDLENFENFWNNKREVIDQRRTNGRYVNEIVKKFYDLFCSYVRDLGRDMYNKGLITDDEITDLYYTWKDMENYFTDDKIQRFRENNTIDELPWLWLTQEEFNKPIRKTILNKLNDYSKRHTIEGRKELIESGKENKQELIDAMSKRVNDTKADLILTDEQTKKLDNLLNIITDDINKNYYFIYPAFSYFNIKWYKELFHLTMDYYKKGNNKGKTEKEIIEGQEKEIKEKKNELQQIKEKEKQIVY